MAELFIEDQRTISDETLFGKQKMPVKKPARRPGGKPAFSFIRRFTDRLYNDPYQW
jgi:hypothetical protein